MKPWDGNSGDVLIWLGTERLLNDLQVRRTLDPRAAEIILIPGGNQTMWQGNIEVWNDVGSRWPDKDFVVGPTTVRLGFSTWREEANRFGAHLKGIFARDPESYAILETCPWHESTITGLSHDPALYLRDSPLIRRHRQAATQEFLLGVFRQDHEGVPGPGAWWENRAGLLPGCLSRRVHSWRERARRQQRIARIVRYCREGRPVKICDAAQYPFPYFLETLRSAAQVHTDRLHCMLLAVMLGKPTFAYPTSFGKLEAIYEHSVKGWAHVEFVRNV